MPPALFSVGVDLGGSWIRLEAVDVAGRKLKSFKAPAPPVSLLPAFLKKRLAAWKAHPRHLIVASRGIWSASERAHLKRGLRSLAKNVVVMSDVEAAWHASFSLTPTPSPDRRGVKSRQFPLPSGEGGRRRRPGEASPKAAGVIVISGTGSIAYGRDGYGCSRRAGGWGPLLGDEGSAFWIGKTWLKKTRRYDFAPDILKLVRSSHHAVRTVAALAPNVMRLARHNSAAKQVIGEAQSHLANLVLSAADHLHFKKALPVSWGGSLLNQPGFRAGFIRALQRNGKKTGLRFQLTPPGRTAVSTVARLASFPAVVSGESSSGSPARGRRG